MWKCLSWANDVSLIFMKKSKVLLFGQFKSGTFFDYSQTRLNCVDKCTASYSVTNLLLSTSTLQQRKVKHTTGIFSVLSLLMFLSFPYILFYKAYVIKSNYNSFVLCVFKISTINPLKLIIICNLKSCILLPSSKFIAKKINDHSPSIWNIVGGNNWCVKRTKVASQPVLAQWLQSGVQ